MVIKAHQAGGGVVSGDDAGMSATYSLIVALRPRSTSAVSPLPSPVRERLRSLGLWTPCRLLGSRPLELRFVYRRGRRAGRRVQQARLSLSSADHCLHLPSTPAVSQATLVFGTLNVRSLLNKCDDIVEVCRDRQIDILCLTESWHDTDSIVLGRLRCSGYNVVDRPRPRAADADDLSVNHGGIVVVSTASVMLSPIVIDQPTTFELVCARAVVGSFAAIVVVLYRPGSEAVQQKFYDELAAVLDRFAAYQMPIYVAGDFNVRLDRPDDPHAIQLRLLVDCYGLVLHDTGPTHQLGGTLDAVITHDDQNGRPAGVTVADVGLSDHYLLRWEVNTVRDSPTPVAVSSRQWRRLDLEQFRSALSTSRLCQPGSWPADIDEMAALYDVELNSVLDQLLPVRHFTRRSRPSDPWFDKECRDAKRLTRRLERAYTQLPIAGLLPRRRPLPLPLRSLPRERRGTTSGVFTVNCGTGSAQSFGATRLKLTSQTRGNCGSPSTSCWVVVEYYQRAPPLTSKPLASSSPTRSLRSACTPAVRHRRRLAVYGLAYRFLRSRL